MARIGGIVLCGGQSSRMGTPKAWLPIGNEVMLQRVVRVLREVLDPVIVVAAEGQDVPALPEGIEIVRDEHEGLGPLLGLVTGLRAIKGKADGVYLSSCDVPFLTSPFVTRVVKSALGEGPGVGLPLAVVPCIDGHLHPLAAAYSLGVLPIAAAELEARHLRMTELFMLFRTHFLDEAELREIDPQLNSLRNVNTPSEYEQALQELLN